MAPQTIQQMKDDLMFGVPAPPPRYGCGGRSVELRMLDRASVRQEVDLILRSATKQAAAGGVPVGQISGAPLTTTGVADSQIVWFALMGALAPTALVVGLLDNLNFDRGLAGSAIVAAAAVLVSLFTRLAWIAHASQRRAAELALRSTALTEALTRQVALGQEFAYRAMHDPLTGLANRAVLVGRLDWFLSRVGSKRHPVLLLVDLDGFKDVNDTYGHPTGDELLAYVSQRLLRAASADAVVARMGGDEFAILFESASKPEAVTKAEQILASIAQPFVVDGQELCLSASIGVLISDPVKHPITASRALRDADLALYAAKNQGKNRFVTFAPRLRVDRTARTSINTGIHQVRSFGEIAA